MADPSDPRRSEPADSRRTILDAARACFSAGGFAGTSMSHIAAAAGVTQSLIHHHFGSKEALWHEVRTAAVRELDARIAEVVGADGPSRSAMAQLFAHLAARPDLLRMCAWARLAGELDAEATGEAQREPLGAIEAGQAAGRISASIPAPHVLIAFKGLVRGWFEDRNLVQGDDATADGLETLDSAYLEAAWAVFSAGAVRRP